MHALWRDVEPGSEDMELYRKGMDTILGGVGVLPINFPGFSLHKALKVCSAGHCYPSKSLLYLKIACEVWLLSFMDDRVEHGFAENWKVYGVFDS